MNFKHKNGSKHYQETTISNRESTFYDKSLSNKFKDHFTALGERKDTSKSYPAVYIEERPSTFYDKALYDEFRDNYHWNFPDDKPKIKRK